MSLSYRRDIDGLRTVAVLPVVFGHAGLALFAGGFVGVDVFFVISGFLITGILAREIEQDRFSLIDFYERRARRILPALFLVLAVCFVVGWFVLPPGKFRGLGVSAIAAILFSSNILFWRNSSDYFALDVLQEPLLHTWSLAVEEQFYLFFPLLLWALARRSRRFVIAVIASLSLTSFVYAVWATHATPITAFYLTPSRIWELGLGSLLALGAFPAPRRQIVAEIGGAGGLLAILFAVFTLNEQSPFPGINALAPCLGAAALIWAGTGKTTWAGRLLSLGPMVGIGLISYSLYLVHWPILVWARLQTGSAHLPLTWAWGCILASVVLAWLSWRYVERPFRSRRDAQDLSRRAIFTVSGIGGAVLLAVFAVVVVSRGLPQRLPQDVARVYAASISHGPLHRECHPREVGAPSCSFGADKADAEPDVIVWGDSHALAMLPGVDLWAKDRGLSVQAFVRTSCPPLIGVRRLKEGLDFPCAEHNALLAERLAAFEKPPLVMLAARWALAAEGTAAPGESTPPIPLEPLDPNAGLPDSDNATVFEYAMDRTFAAIVPHARQVLIVGGVPEIGFHVPNTLVETTLIWKDMPVPPALEAYGARNARSNDILTRLADQYGVRFTELGALFCTPICQIRDETGALFYYDDDHLSDYGAKRFMPLVLEQAFPALSGS